MAIIGNSIFMITLLKTRSLHTPSNVLLGSLCFSDLLVAFITQPIHLSFHIKMLIDRSINNTLFEVSAAALQFCVGLSFQFAILVTLDRFVAICYPYRYHASANCKTHISISITAVVLWAVFNVFEPHLRFNSIFEAFRFLFLGLSLMIMAGSYIKIYHVIRKQTQAVSVTLGEITAERNKSVAVTKGEMRGEQTRAMVTTDGETSEVQGPFVTTTTTETRGVRSLTVATTNGTTKEMQNQSVSVTDGGMRREQTRAIVTTDGETSEIQDPFVTTTTTKTKGVRSLIVAITNVTTKEMQNQSVSVTDRGIRGVQSQSVAVRIEKMRGEQKQVVDAKVEDTIGEHKKIEEVTNKRIIGKQRDTKVVKVEEKLDEENKDVGLQFKEEITVEKKQRIRLRKCEVKKTHTMAIIVVTFLILYLPGIGLLINDFSRSTKCINSTESLFGFMWSCFLVFANSTLNPVVYFLRVTEIRAAARSNVCPLLP